MQKNTSSHICIVHMLLKTQMNWQIQLYSIAEVDPLYLLSHIPFNVIVYVICA